MRCAAILILALAGTSSSALALPAPELPITVESLGLTFSTPVGWRLLADSTPDGLLLAPGKSKITPILRIAAFRGRLSARDRLPEMARGLEGEEKLVSFVSTENWTLDSRSFETVTARYKKGSQEWYARFTVVDQPDKLQHGFWIFGRKQDIERQWKAVQASIRSSVIAGAPTLSEKATPDTPEDTAPAGRVWKDVKSGLRVAAWPVDYEPEQASLARLSTSGLVLKPTAPSAPASAELRLSRRGVSELVTAASTIDTLEERLGQASGVGKVQRLKVRVAGEPAISLRWTQRVKGEDYSFEVCTWKHGTSLYRLDAGATTAWASARKRRDLLKQFTAGLSFP